MAEKTHGPLVNVATDGDAERRLLLAQEFSTVQLETLGCEWADELGFLDLMDKTVGPNGITQTFDLKHIVKRMRTRDKCKTKGMQIGAGTSLNAETIIPLFDMFFGKQSWDSLFQPDDR